MTHGIDPHRGLGQKLSDQPLFLCIGDSYTYGDGVEFNQAWPHVLSQQLPEYQVVNAGIRGANLAMMQDALQHYQEQKSAAHILLTILDIDILRLSGHLQDEEYFMDESNFNAELDRNCELLQKILESSTQKQSRVSVHLWGRDVFITRFQKLSGRFSAICSGHGVTFRNDIANLMSVLSHKEFSISAHNGHPGEYAHRLIAKHMFDAFAEERRKIHNAQ